MKHALVSSGGGSMGAWGSGQAQYLVEEQGMDFDIVGGTSTGGLKSPLEAIGRFEKLRKAYTTVGNSDIWTSNPFRVKKNDKTGINLLAIAKERYKKNVSLGDSSQIRKTIDQFLTMDDYQRIIDLDKDVYCCVGNYTKKTIEYKSIRECNTLDDYKDWMQATSAVVPFMSPVVKNGCFYIDGGFGEHVPAQYAIDKGATEIDVIIHDTKDPKQNPNPKNPLQFTLGCLSFMHEEIKRNDLRLKHKGSNVNIRLYYTPRILTENSIVFDSEEMSAWWDEGYEYIRKNGPDVEYQLKANGIKCLYEKK